MKKILTIVLITVFACEHNELPKPTSIDTSINAFNDTLSLFKDTTLTNDDSIPLSLNYVLYTIDKDQLSTIGINGGFTTSSIIYIFDQNPIVTLQFGYYTIFQGSPNGLYMVPNANENYYAYYLSHVDLINQQMDSVKLVYTNGDSYLMHKEPFISTPPIYWELNPVEEILIYCSDLQ